KFLILIILSVEYMLVMEYADGGTLRQYLSINFGKMDWDLKLKFAKQISSAVFCLHENDIIHRDLVNFLINKLIYFFTKNIKCIDYFYICILIIITTKHSEN